MLPSSSMKHHMELRDSNKKTSDQVPRRTNRVIKDQPTRRCDLEARDRTIPLM